MNLKDQKLESVKLAKELLDKNPSSDYVISLILEEDKIKKSSKLKTLIEKNSIDSSFSILDFTKKYKTEELDYLKFLLNSQKSQSFNYNFDELVKYFLGGKIKYTDIIKYLTKVIKLNQLIEKILY